MRSACGSRRKEALIIPDTSDGGMSISLVTSAATTSKVRLDIPLRPSSPLRTRDDLDASL